jgi:hypothetical protein
MRPRLNPDTHRKDIALTLPPQLIERAKSVCKIAGWSVSSVVEKALTNHLNALDREIRREIRRKCAEILADDLFTVMHQVNGQWRVWANFKTLRGAEKEAAKVTTRPVKILLPNTPITDS